MTQSLLTSIHMWMALGLWCDRDAKFVSFGIFSSYGLGKFIKSIPCVEEGSIKPTSCLIGVCLPCSEMPPLMTSPEKLSSSFFSSLLEDSSPIPCAAVQAYYFSCCPRWTWKTVCSFPFCSVTQYYQVSSQSFSLNNSSVFNLSFYVRFSGPLMSFHCSPQGYLHLAPSVKCSVQMGQSISAELFPMLKKKHHLAFLYVSQSYQCLLFQHLGQQLFLNLRVNQRSLAIRECQSKAGYSDTALQHTPGSGWTGG